jgi:limonene-1,2-epoxide hydrolase
MQETDLEALVRAYLKAFEERDLDRCVDFYADDATIDFQIGVFQGEQAIEKWHRDRFAADFKIVRVDGIAVQGSSVVLEAFASSKRLRTWKLSRLGGKATFRFEGGKIKEARFSARAQNILETW